MPKLKFTQIAVSRLNPPAEKHLDYFDESTPGFGIRINSGGRKSWIVVCYCRGKQIWHTIGDTTTYTLAEARELAREAKKQARSGINPSEARRAQAVEEKAADEAEKAQERANSYTLRKMVDEYLPWSKAKHKLKTFKENGYVLARVLRLADFADQPAASITQQQIKAYGYAVPPGQRGEIERWNQIVALGRVFAWAEERDKVPSNPVEKIKIAAKPKARKRVLTDAELVAFWRAAEGLHYPFGPMFQLLALLGQRLTETAAARWSEIDLDAGIWTIPAHRAKNNQEHRVPLPALAIDILKSLPRYYKTDWCFTTTTRGPILGFNPSKLKIEQAIGADDWVLHDLRRTFASGLQRLHVRLEVTENLLNHRSGSRAGIVAVYQTYTYWDERKEAMNDWAKFLAWLVEDRPPVTLRA